MPILSKSRIIAFRQCPRRLWLEVHRPDLRSDSASTERSYAIGNQIGEIARQLYDPDQQGEALAAQRDGYESVCMRTKTLLQGDAPIFEAGFEIAGARAFADVMRPSSSGSGWDMVEIKSAASVKDYYRDDLAVQTYICRASGAPLNRTILAHVDRTFVYPGDGKYEGLLLENDLTEETVARADEVKAWLDEAHAVAEAPAAPEIRCGPQCSSPFECGFISYCQSLEPQSEYPVSVLPRVQTKSLKHKILVEGVRDLREIDDGLLNAKQLRVKQATLSGQVYFDVDGARTDLAHLIWPLHFLDFETAQLPIPVWAGYRPYDQVPFQFSLHVVERNGDIRHHEFLDLTGNDPSQRFAEALVAACGSEGTILCYNASFEVSQVLDLAKMFPEFDEPLYAIRERIFDLLKVVEARYYHPAQQGSWSIKKVLPTIAPDLQYDDLDGVQSGSMIGEVYIEAALDPATTSERKRAIEVQLRKYCGLDTWAMVRVWNYLTGTTLDLKKE